MKIKQRNIYVAAGHFRQEQELPFGKVIAYTDGKTGWLSTPQGVIPMPAPVLKQAQGELFRNLLHVMLADRDSTLKVNAVAKNKVEISSADQSATVDFDESTGLPSRLAYQEAAGPTGPTEVSESFSDWRDVDGVKLPFKMALRQGEKKLGDLAVQEYKFNSGLKPEELSKKP
jgi:hypothetical protein